MLGWGDKQVTLPPASPVSVPPRCSDVTVSGPLTWTAERPVPDADAPSSDRPAGRESRWARTAILRRQVRGRVHRRTQSVSGAVAAVHNGIAAPATSVRQVWRPSRTAALGRLTPQKGFDALTRSPPRILTGGAGPFRVTIQNLVTAVPALMSKRRTLPLRERHFALRRGSHEPGLSSRPSRGVDPSPGGCWFGRSSMTSRSFQVVDSVLSTSARTCASDGVGMRLFDAVRRHDALGERGGAGPRPSPDQARSWTAWPLAVCYAQWAQQ